MIELRAISRPNSVYDPTKGHTSGFDLPSGWKPLKVGEHFVYFWRRVPWYERLWRSLR